jgi:hypothetical protein
MITDSLVSSDAITIHAPAAFIWDILVDFENYHLWNRFCPEIRASLELNSPVEMMVDLGQGPQPQTEFMCIIEPPNKIAWRMENRPDDPVHATRIQTLAPLDEASCQYLSVDEFSGPACKDMLEAFGQAIETGFNLCATNLKAYAEQQYQKARQAEN